MASMLLPAKTKLNWKVLVGILATSVLLRAPAISVNLVLSSIQQELGLSASQAGLLGNLPLAAFAVASGTINQLQKLVKTDQALLLGTMLISIGVVVRSYTSFLYFGMIIVGFGCAINNVLIPGLVKYHFPRREGLITGLYTALMSLGTGLASLIVTPVAMASGWRNGLATWLFFSIPASILWLPQLFSKDKTPSAQKGRPGGASLLTSPKAWIVTAFVALQSVIYFSFHAWLPTITLWRGWDVQNAALFTMILQFVSVPFSLVMPYFLQHAKRPRAIILVVGVVYLAGMLLCTFSQGETLFVLGIIGCSIGKGVFISVALYFQSACVKDSLQAVKLSGMAMTTGYLLSAVGPALMGFTFDMTGSWLVPLLGLAALIVALCGSGLAACQVKEV